MGNCCPPPRPERTFEPIPDLEEQVPEQEDSDRSTPPNSPRQTTANLLLSMGFDDDIEPANLEDFVAEDASTNATSLARSATLAELAFNEFRQDDAGWIDFKKADYVKGRHRTQLDKQAQRYIKDIARSRIPFDEILKDIRSKYSIQRPKAGRPAEDETPVPADYTKGLRHDVEIAEVVLPYLDVIITNHSTVEGYWPENKKLSVALEFQGKKTYTKQTLLLAIKTVFRELAKGETEKEKEKDAKQMLDSALVEVNVAQQTTQDYQSELTDWPELVQYILAVQFYLGNYAGDEDSPVGDDDDALSDTTAMQQDRKKKGPTYDNRAAKAFVYGRGQDAFNKEVQEADDSQTLHDMESLYGDAQQEELASIQKKCPEEFMEITWWVNRALAFVQPYRGKCLRKTNFSSDAEKAYYQPGKIFRFQNILSAVKVDKFGAVAGPDEFTGELWFHIYSIGGRDVKQFTGSGSKMENQENVVLFRTGAEFLICKVEEKEGIKHVYIRQIELGWGQNVVFWLDDDMYVPGSELMNWIRWNSFNNFKQNIKFITRSSTNIALSYFRSEIFRVSLNMSKRYKLIQDKTRTNEKRILFEGKHQQIQPHYAAPRFLRDFKKKTKDLDQFLVNKIEMAIYCLDKAKLPETFREFDTYDDLVNNNFSGTNKRQWEGFESNVFVMSDVDNFGKWFNMSKAAVNPKNVKVGKRNQYKPRPNRKKK